MAGVRPDLVVSLTSVGSPHMGVDLLEQFGGGLEGLEDLVDFLGSAVELLWGLLGNDNPTDMVAALKAFSAEAMAEFNNDPVFGKGMPASYCGEGGAVALLDTYLDFRDAMRELAEAGEVPQDLERRWQWIRELRRHYFGAATSAALFGREEEVVRVRALDEM